MHIWGKGRAAGRVGSDILPAIVGRVGSTFRRVGSGPRKVTRGQLCDALQEPSDHHREPEDHVGTKYQGGRAYRLQFAHQSSCRWHTRSSRQGRCHDAYLVALFNGGLEYFPIHQYHGDHPNYVRPVIKQTLDDEGVWWRTRREINSSEIDGVENQRRTQNTRI